MTHRISRWLPLTGVWLALTASAASTPDVAILDDGTVEGSMWLDASPERVRQVLTDAARTAAMAPDILTAQSAASGDCERVQMQARGLFTPFEIETRRCPTAGGWEESLVDSVVFLAWTSSWQVTPQQDGTTVVTYRIRTEIGLPVPGAMVRRRTAASLHTSLVALAQAVEA